MPATTHIVRRAIRQRYKSCPVDCPLYVETVIETLSDFFAVFYALLESTKLFWFRGHPSMEYRLAPSALRYPDEIKRAKALALTSEMKRFLEFKLSRPPAPTDELGWMQVAQHYGLPTRLLDWTQNAAVALFFACNKDADKDGAVIILNPIELNMAVDPKDSRVFSVQTDLSVITPYFSLSGKTAPKGRPTIAINPTWNTERIALQHGAFTLHGSKTFDLDRKQASSLLLVPILSEHKPSLMNELERVGVGEMFIFPEPEHVCSHLRHRAGL